MRNGLLIFFLIFLVHCAKAKDQIKTKYFYSDGENIRDNEGRIIFLRGVNLSNAHKYRDKETGEFFPKWLTENVFEEIASLGFNSIRFLVTWEGIEPQPRKYNKEYINKILNFVRMSASYNLVVIIDFHQDIYSSKYGGNGAPEWAAVDDGLEFRWQNPWYSNYAQPAVVRAFENFWKNKNGIQDNFINSIVQVARALKDEKNVVGYEIMNEPSPGKIMFNKDELSTFEREYLQPFYERVAKEVLSVDDKRLIFFEPLAVRTNVLAPDGFPSGFEPFKEPLFVFSPHLYDPVITMREKYDTNKERLVKSVKVLIEESKRLSTPLWVGEWGVWPKTAEDGSETCCIENADKFLQDILSVFDEFKISWAIWNYNKDEDPADIAKYWKDELRSLQLTRVPGQIKYINFDGKEYKAEIYCDSDSYTEIKVPDGFLFEVTPSVQLENSKYTYYLKTKKGITLKLTAKVER